MRGGVRKFGAAERGLLPEGRIAGPMPWVIAIMMFLTVLAAAAGLGLGGAAARLNDQIGGRITLQVVEADPVLRQRQAEAAAAAIRRLPGVVVFLEVPKGEAGHDGHGQPGDEQFLHTPAGLEQRPGIPRSRI